MGADMEDYGALDLCWGRLFRDFLGNLRIIAFFCTAFVTGSDCTF